MIMMMIIMMMIMMMMIMMIMVKMMMLMMMTNRVRGNQSFIKQLQKSHQKDLCKAEAITCCKKA